LNDLLESFSTDTSMTATMEGGDEAVTLRKLEEQLLDASVRASADQVSNAIFKIQCRTHTEKRIAA
jgi:chorismate-pyruvate lyase